MCVGQEFQPALSKYSCNILPVTESHKPMLAGRISLKVLTVYIAAMGGWFRFLLFISWFIMVEVARVASTVWLSYWTGVVDTPGGAPHPALWYLAIYAGISGVQVWNEG